MSADDDVDDEGRRGRARRATPHSDKNEEKQVKEGRKEGRKKAPRCPQSRMRKEGRKVVSPLGIRVSCQMETTRRRQRGRREERKSEKAGRKELEKEEGKNGRREVGSRPSRGKGEIHYVRVERQRGASERGNRHLYRRKRERERERELAWDLN